MRSDIERRSKSLPGSQCVRKASRVPWRKHLSLAPACLTSSAISSDILSPSFASAKLVMWFKMLRDDPPDSHCSSSESMQAEELHTGMAFLLDACVPGLPHPTLDEDAHIHLSLSASHAVKASFRLVRHPTGLLAGQHLSSVHPE